MLTCRPKSPSIEEIKVIIWCSRSKKLSDYGNQLFAKQKLKFYYGDLTERQFRISSKASNIKGDKVDLIEL